MPGSAHLDPPATYGPFGLAVNEPVGFTPGFYAVRVMHIPVIRLERVLESNA
jgi:hypothetical protein